MKESKLQFIILFFSDQCEDTNIRDGVTTSDKMDLDCHHYKNGAADCKNSDIHKDEDFEAKRDCCACGGGTIKRGMTLID